MSLRCIFGHRWKVVEYEGPYEVGYGFGWAFGNSWVTRKCQRCGKTKREPAFLGRGL